MVVLLTIYGPASIPCPEQEDNDETINMDGDDILPYTPQPLEGGIQEPCLNFRYTVIIALSSICAILLLFAVPTLARIIFNLVIPCWFKK